MKHVNANVKNIKHIFLVLILAFVFTGCCDKQPPAAKVEHETLTYKDAPFVKIPAPDKPEFVKYAVKKAVIAGYTYYLISEKDKFILESNYNAVVEFALDLLGINNYYTSYLKDSNVTKDSNQTVQP